ncbi:hypothetical protein [Litoribrevibacter albus]|uniref:Uncharacterized protein n=1 Tax=Litoribrevibacter albus TaxID=1473156 RepID=A0AA37S871_9GAMM|nr:hypothetical protein [Litoribrevibacter albus]GLQ29793.1 hypothetical protein GCM10007876_02710 [Litoribrevibacter albus]
MSFAIKSNHHRQLIKLLQQHQRGKLRPQWSHKSDDHLDNQFSGNELTNQLDQRKTLSGLMRDSDHNLLIL